MTAPRALAALAALVCSPAAAQVAVDVTLLRQEVERPPVLSNLDPVPEDLAVAGARVGTDDNATTGRFLGHEHALEVISVAPGGDWEAAAREALARSPLIVADAPAEALLALADLPEARGALILNATAEDTRLRGADCRAGVLHTAPSLAMRTDALAQFLQARRWDDLALVSGTREEDRAFAEALRGSLAKFGLEVAGEVDWPFDADIRRNAGREVPLLTQGLPDHDVLLLADAADDFGRYVAYNTWDARPVAGTEGLVAVAWAPVVEQWGAAQLQGRFEEAAGRDMEPEDYGAWAAVRAIGEAVTRTGTADPAALRAFMLSEAFELAGFKGRPLSFRDWNGQLRQPIPVVQPRALVASAPLEGFLHERTELDTLGLDRPESGCTAFEGSP